MDSPLAKLQRPSKRTTTPRLALPEAIVLPDGRKFDVRELLKQTTRSEVYNLRRNRTRPINRNPTRKYTFEERLWMATATIQEVMERFGVSDKYARTLISQGRNLERYRYLIEGK